jgi:hypothetical protein
MSHVTSLLPHPSNTPSWLSIREKPEWPHSLSCPVLEGWGLPPGLTSSETGGFGRTCRGHSKWYPWPCGLKKGDALSKKWRWQPLWCGHCPRQTSWSLHLARVPTLVSKPHLQRVSLKWSSLLPLVSLSPPEGPSSFPNVPFQWKPSIPSIPQTSCYMLCAVQSAHFYKPHFDTSDVSIHCVNHVEFLVYKLTPVLASLWTQIDNIKTSTMLAFVNDRDRVPRSRNWYYGVKTQ